MADGSGKALLAGDERSAAVAVNRRSFAFWFGVAAVAVALASGIATSLILTGLTRIRPSDGVVVFVIVLNIVMMLPLVAAIGWQILNLWRARKRRAAGSRLHIRIVALFSIIALLPAILLAAFAALSLNRALDQVFSKRIKGIVSNSLSVAQAYVEEHAQVLRGDTVAMARDIDAVALIRSTEPERFRSVLSTQAGMRDLALAFVIDGEGKVLVATEKAAKAGYLPPPPSALREAASGGIAVIAPGRSNRIGSIQRLASSPDVYLFVQRPVDAKVLNYLSQTEQGVQQYSELGQLQRGIKIASGIMYVMIALTLLLISIWLGFWFANRLIAPIRRLIAAAQRISQGDLDVQVPVRGAESDLRQLARTFNMMSGELRTQRDELVSTNTQLIERRRFMEAVLSGVSAGVLGLDAAGKVTLANPSAEILLGRSADQLVGHLLADSVPEIAAMLDSDGSTHRPRQQQQVTLRVNGDERTFAVRLTREQSGGESEGTVVTFDDITELVTAQRTSAWADIARRIAHEIKNPLTPIQLAAERLKRKYGNVIVEDRETFDKCVGTIVRQVGDIGRMVDEFSSFARMPKPQMEREDVRRVVRDAVALYEVGSADIDIVVETPDGPVPAICDRRLISQAMTNLIKNAGEAIQTGIEQGAVPAGTRGRIVTRLRASNGVIEIDVIDNGVGLPKTNRGRLKEPYVTTRGKGTGLGLAIVQKIMEQHDGVLLLEDAPSIDGEEPRGAMVRLRFKDNPARDVETSDAPGGGLADEKERVTSRDVPGSPARGAA